MKAALAVLLFSFCAGAGVGGCCDRNENRGCNSAFSCESLIAVQNEVQNQREPAKEETGG